MLVSRRTQRIHSDLEPSTEKYNDQSKQSDLDWIHTFQLSPPEGVYGGLLFNEIAIQTGGQQISRLNFLRKNANFTCLESSKETPCDLKIFKFQTSPGNDDKKELTFLKM